MKTKALALFTTLTLLFTFNSKAQIISGGGNGQSPASSVGASEVTSGGFAGDVSLFSGTFNSSYTLGSVSTNSGISYTATMTHSSTYATGDNLPHVSGVPYGEGWNVDIPTISMSVEDYNKFTLLDSYWLGVDQNLTETYHSNDDGCRDAREEGQLYWFAPTISIPGVGSGRLVYKYFKGNRYIFVLHKFERYIEAQFTGTYWEVFLDDGTVYQFDAHMVSHRNSSNQRVENVCSDLDYGVEDTDGYDIKNLTLPKTEILTWNCTQIRHKNLVGRINFLYEKYGAFDFHKVFKQAKTEHSINTKYYLNNPFHSSLQKAYKDIYLTEISSSYERLVLDYQLISLPTGTVGMLDAINDPDVERIDSLYAKKTIEEWGGNSGKGFGTWFRYKHLKKDGYGYDITKTNPYTGIISNGGSINYHDRQSLSGSAVPFNHGFLESPRLQPDPQNMPLGDIYELETTIHTDWSNNPSADCLFDINLATGDNQNQSGGGGPLGNSAGQVLSTDYNRTRGESVYTTFNKATKWYNWATGHPQNNTPDDEMITSDFFVMPNLPNQYEGFNIQVGPANSDNKFDEFSLQVHGSGTTPSICNTYFNNMTGAQAINSGDEMKNNFGIGTPWAMMVEFYAHMNSNGIGFCETPGTNTWWNDGTNQGISWPNIPTRADDDIELRNAKLIRYSKVPYMLKSAKKEVFNTGENSIPNLCDTESYWRTISHLRFEYEHDLADVYNTFIERENGVDVTKVQSTSFQRNIFLLKRIIQLPPDVSSDTPMGDYPTTHFSYVPNTVSEIPFSGIILDTYFEPTLSGFINSNLSVINEIKDPLGKVTKIDFLPFDYGNGSTSYATSRYQYKNRPNELFGLENGGIRDFKQAPGYALQIYLVVDSIRVEDRSGDKYWNYTFSGRSANWDDVTPLSMNYYYDRFDGGIKKGFETTIVEGPKQGGGSSPKVVYNHNTSELFWGKVDKVETFDANGSLISRNESEYESVYAFEPATHRAGVWQSDDWDYYDYYGVYDDRELIEDYPGNLSAYNKEFRKWLKNRIIAGNSSQEYQDWVTEGETIVVPTLSCTGVPPQDCNCDNYDNLIQGDQDLCDQYWAEYHEWLLDRPEESIDFFRTNHPDIAATGGRFDTPKFYESREDRVIENSNPDYLYSFFIKKTKDTQTVFDDICKGGSGSIQTITEYTYYDADYRGVPTDPSTYEPILGYQPTHLYYEPSWQLYKKKVTTPQLAAETEEEHFYLYDLINNSSFHVSTSDHEIRDDYFMLKKMYVSSKMRSLPYETRMTTKAPGEDEIIRSNYFIYKDDWIDRKEEGTNVTLNELTDNPCGVTFPCILDEDGDGNDDGGFGSVYTSDGYQCFVIQEAPNNYDCPHEDFPSYWCPCESEESNDPVGGGGGGGQQSPPDPYGDTDPYLTHRLSGKVYLSEVHTQVESGAGTTNILTYDANFEPVFPYKHIKTNEILTRNLWGQVVRERNERDIVTFYDYGATTIHEFPDCEDGHEVVRRFYEKNTSGQPVAVTVGAGTSIDEDNRPDALTTQYEYNLDHTIAKITDPNGMELTYGYDVFKRMNAAYRNGNLIQSVVYDNWDNIDTDFKSKAAQNFVSTTNYVDPSLSWRTKAFVDPLGRNVANMREGVMVEDNIYDIYDQPTIKLKPNYGFVPSVNFTAGLPEDHAEFEFDTPGRSRVLKSSKYGESITGIHVVTNEYCMVAAADLQSKLTLAGQTHMPHGSVFYKTETKDEDGKYVWEYTNALGQKAAIITNNGDYATVFFYDSHGNVMETYNPEEQKTEYKYNYVGLLHEKITVDGGNTYYGYDHSGNLISEDPADSRVVLYEYDDYGRMIGQVETQTAYDANEGLEWLSTLTVNDDKPDYTSYHAILNAVSSAYEKQWFYNDYDQSNTGDYSGNAMPYLQNSITNALGRLVQTISNDQSGNRVEYKWYSYNNDGFLKWEMMQLKKPKDKLVRIDYPEYNLQGSYKKQNVDLNGDQVLDFQYRYDYDYLNRISIVYANYNNPDSGSGNKIVEYRYDDVKDVVQWKKYFDREDEADGLTCTPSTADVEVDHISYGHDDRFRLESINSYLFDYTLFYDTDQPLISGSSPADNFNGNINGHQAVYKTTLAANGNDASIMIGPTDYQFTYDNLNRLTDANAYVANGLNLTNHANWGDATYIYDKIGNFTTLTRWVYEGTSTSVDPESYGYQYGTGNNRLMTITSTGPNRTFTYDADGNMTYDSKKQMNVTYDRANLPWTISKANNKGGTDNISYYYDASDARIFKSITSDGETNQEYYIRSASGQELAVYNMANDKITWYIYGNERVAKIHQKSDADFEDDPGSEICDPNPPACNPTELAQQQAALPSIRTGMANRNVGNVGVPTKLYRLRLCDGTEFHLLEDELPLLPGNYMTLQTININSASQQFTISGNGTTGVVDLAGLLLARVFDENAYIDNYEPCINQFICNDGAQIYNAHSIGSSTLFSDYNNDPPYYDMTQNHINADRTLQDDGLEWLLFGVSNMPDEAEWDVSYDFTDPTGITITGYKVIIDHNTACINPGDRALFALHDGSGFIPVNGGQLTVEGLCNTDTFEIVPDQMPTALQVENMRLAIYRSGVVADRINIDVIKAELSYDYICPCEQPKPDCPGQMFIDQGTSLGNLNTEISNKNINTVVFPTKLYRVRFCDSTEYNVLRDEMSIVEGGGTILQRLVVQDSSQLFVVEQNGLHTTVPFTDVINIRKTDKDIPVSYPCDPPINDPYDDPLDEKNGEGLDIYFYIHDHLGNTRVLYHTEFDCEDPTINYIFDHVVDYYPYGKVLREYVNGEEEKFLTTHHERDQETDLDYRGARFYDADIGRFLSLDPLAAEYPSWSDYNYVVANPIIVVDPDGRSPDYVSFEHQGSSSAITSGINWSLFTIESKWKLLYQGNLYAYRERVGSTKGIGYFFEEIFEAYVTGGGSFGRLANMFLDAASVFGVPNNNRFNFYFGDEGGSRPDFIGDGIFTTARKSGLGLTIERTTIPGAAWYDAKALHPGATVELTNVFNDTGESIQAKKHIDNLAALKLNAEDPWGMQGYMVYPTTAGVKISKEVSDHAYQNNIVLIQLVALYKEDSRGNVQFQFIQEEQVQSFLDNQ